MSFYSDGLCGLRKERKKGPKGNHLSAFESPAVTQNKVRVAESRDMRHLNQLQYGFSAGAMTFPNAVYESRPHELAGQD